MSELTLLILRIGFLILLWAFVFAIVYALRSDLFGQKVRRLPAPNGASAASASPAPSTAPASSESATARTEAIAPAPAAPAPTAQEVADEPVARRLVITSGAKEGMELELGDDQLTIGRSADSGLVIRDDYTSTHHARLMLWSDQWMIQDLDSTNGTFLNGKRVSIPTPVPLNTPVSIGTTTFELRR
ncbi:FHA domain-containing protein [Microcella alkalica]|uniref:PSer/pThr/pTyr-binding forkhead associated (FHA) protein n=1 Tax=Microcella alkalica TaxID=355930 RepID=A0A839EBP1_9MICO|nr:FHA domain-containing protein [Microcella alkalica]MBA8848563.1 pSer/pThr/pTyr-binding forkhead associated (FHA) protein [Microcella alkalica]